MNQFDIILVGGGLANGLIADRLAVGRRNLHVLIVEAGDRLGGDHTWSYHASDVTTEQDRWLKSIGRAAWDTQTVQFPAYTRTLDTGYRTMTGHDLHRRLTSYDHLYISLSTRVASVADDKITLEGGREIHGTCIIDGRGMHPAPELKLGYQKFFGLECDMREPHGLSGPILMDATVAQTDGYRFIYCLPYSPTLMLIEDTYYSATPELNTTGSEQGIRTYAQTRGWEINVVEREESGVLPVVMDGDLDMIWPSHGTTPRSGMRAGLFHHTTGYSLPFAARIADNLVKHDVLNSQTIAAYVRTEAQNAWQNQTYFRLLNRLLFLAAQNEEPRGIFERFYRLPKSLIESFYAADLNAWHKFRILFGSPPVSVQKALAAMPPNAAADRVALGQLSGEEGT